MTAEFFAATFLSRLRVRLRAARLRDVPRHQLLDASDGVVGNGVEKSAVSDSFIEAMPGEAAGVDGAAAGVATVYGDGTPFRAMTSQQTIWRVGHCPPTACSGLLTSSTTPSDYFVDNSRPPIDY